jgi:hypothetical protein
MLIKLVAGALLLTLVAACGGAATGPTTPAASRPASGGSPPTAASGGNGAVDCVAIKTAAVELLGIQLLAQLKSADAVAQIKAKQFGNLDLDRFLAAMHTLHALDGRRSPLGDPKPDIEFYEKAGTAAKVLFAADPVTQAALDTYNENVGSVTAFIGHQTSISAAIDEAC